MPLPPEDSKIKVLRANGTLHPHPEKVQDEVFKSHEFFDPRDHVQVKYEMLRRHRTEGKSVTEVTKSFGTSRQAFYQTKKAFEADGITSLAGHRRGPKHAHKCTDELLDFVEKWRASHPPDDQSLIEELKLRFAVTVHPRSIDRALIQRKKKRKTTNRRKPA
jgi:transposase